MIKFDVHLLLLCILCAARAAAQGDPARVFDPPRAPDDKRLERAITLDGYHPWKLNTDLDAWNERRQKVRRQILVAAGLWPMPPKTPLKPVIHGAIDRGDYTIEKVYLQSYPGFYVTGNLYRPKGASGKRPAVLSPHGHWANGRFYERPDAEAGKYTAAGEEKTMEGSKFPLQARCAQLARMGCVVFHYDMVGYADSKQIQHRAGFGDARAELRLQSAFGLQTWNTIRALDFLLSLPEVDASRVGVTGASGGGTQTFILCAIDDRPAAAFPAVMVSTGMQGGCICENASHLRVGTGNIEFAALAAPRPYGMTGANDWTKEIMTKGLPELRALYSAYGKEDLVQAWCYLQFGHNYNQVSREHMYDWFNRHLKLGLPSPVKERSFEPVPPAELSVFGEERRLPDDAVDAAGLRKWLAETSDRQIADLAPKDAAGLAEFRSVIGGALESMLHTHLPAEGEVAREDLGETTFEGCGVRKLLLGRKGNGESVPAILVKPENWNGIVAVVVHGRGKANLFSDSSRADSAKRLGQEPKRILKSGAAILSPDLFLTGEYLGKSGGKEIAGPDSPLFRRDGKRHKSFVGYTYGYNRTLVAQRVHDILTAVGYAGSLPGSRGVHLVGLDDAASWAVLAKALAGDAVAKAVVASRSFVDYGGMDSHDDPDFVPGGLKYGGMPYFTALCAPGELRLVTAEEPSDIVLTAYRAAGHPDRVRYLDWGDAHGELLDWISR